MEKPIYLFADSQPLFCQNDVESVLTTLPEVVGASNPKAAYLGASNGDVQAFYDIFVAAMENFGVKNVRMVASTPSSEALAFLEQADVVLLAGGDVRRGWQVFRSNGVCEIIRRRYHEGVVLIGVSAGAVQLGKYAWISNSAAEYELFETFQLVPFLISVHEEKDWPQLKRAVQLAGHPTRGIGIARGGGLIYYPDHMIQPVLLAAREVWLGEDTLCESVLLPENVPVVPENSSQLQLLHF